MSSCEHRGHLQWRTTLTSSDLSWLSSWSTDLYTGGRGEGGGGSPQVTGTDRLWLTLLHGDLGTEQSVCEGLLEGGHCTLLPSPLTITLSQLDSCLGVAQDTNIIHDTLLEEVRRITCCASSLLPGRLLDWPNRWGLPPKGLSKRRGRRALTQTIWITSHRQTG